ncbi:membrane protein insertion efficiency factor YidD [Patescibacteria group bacterium]|nr:membrane protein insertion efficiency factor YidD [Patescibacteria group bacterium]
MVKFFILKIIKFYQLFISPKLGRTCRFFPSCSEYFCLAIEKHGVVKGLYLGIKRITRCHPWNQGGIDMP